MTKNFPALAILLLAAAHAAAADDKDIHVAKGRVQGFKWQLSDGAEYKWDITQHGQVSDGTDDAYDGGMALKVNGAAWAHNRPGVLSKDGREIEIGPWAHGALRVWRRIYVDGKVGYCRWIDVFQNVSGKEQAVKVAYATNTGSNLRGVHTTSGKAALTKMDWGLATSAAAPDTSRPSVVHIFASGGSELKPTVEWSTNSDMVSYKLAIKVPAKKTVALCFFQAQRRPYEQAKRLVKTFSVETELRKVPTGLRRIILNMGGALMVLGTLELPRNEQHDVVIKRNGDQLFGTIQNAVYAIEDAACGRLEIPADRVVGLSFSSWPGSYVRVGLADGQVLAGRLVSGPIKLRRPGGGEIGVLVKQLKTASYKLSRERPEEIVVTRPTVVLRTGQRLFFGAENMVLTFHTEHGELKLACSDLHRISFDAPEGGLHRVVFGNGSVLSGMLTAGEFAFRLDLGKEVTVRRETVELISIPHAGRKNGPVATLSLRNDDLLYGRLLAESISIGDRSGRVPLKTAEVAQMRFPPEAPLGTVEVKLHNGSKLSGRFLGDTIRFQIGSGPVLQVFMGHVSQITCPKGSTGALPTTRPAETKATGPETRPAGKPAPSGTE